MMTTLWSVPRPVAPCVTRQRWCNGDLTKSESDIKWHKLHCVKSAGYFGVGFMKPNMCKVTRRKKPVKMVHRGPKWYCWFWWQHDLTNPLIMFATMSERTQWVLPMSHEPMSPDVLFFQCTIWTKYHKYLPTGDQTTPVCYLLLCWFLCGRTCGFLPPPWNW